MSSSSKYKSSTNTSLTKKPKDKNTLNKKTKPPMKENNNKVKIPNKTHLVQSSSSDEDMNDDDQDEKEKKIIKKTKPPTKSKTKTQEYTSNDSGKKIVPKNHSSIPKSIKTMPTIKSKHPIAESEKESAKKRIKNGSRLAQKRKRDDSGNDDDDDDEEEEEEKEEDEEEEEEDEEEEDEEKPPMKIKSKGIFNPKNGVAGNSIKYDPERKERETPSKIKLNDMDEEVLVKKNTPHTGKNMSNKSVAITLNENEFRYDLEGEYQYNRGPFQSSETTEEESSPLRNHDYGCAHAIPLTNSLISNQHVHAQGSIVTNAGMFHTNGLVRCQIGDCVYRSKIVALILSRGKCTPIKPENAADHQKTTLAIVGPMKEDFSNHSPVPLKKAKTKSTDEVYTTPIAASTITTKTKSNTLLESSNIHPTQERIVNNRIQEESDSDKSDADNDKSDSEDSDS